MLNRTKSVDAEMQIPREEVKLPVTRRSRNNAPKSARHREPVKMYAELTRKKNRKNRGIKSLRDNKLDMADWIAVVKDNSGTNRPLTLNLIETAWIAASYDNDTPTVLTMKNNIYASLWSLFVPAQRLVSEEMEGLGFKNILSVNGAPALYDDHMVANQIYLINENHLQLAVSDKEDMRYVKISDLEGQAASLGRIFWAGNLVCSSRRTQAVVKDVSAAS